MSVVKIVHLVLDLLLLVFNPFMFNPRAPGYDDSDLSRKNFPDGFVFGAASSAYQYEGAYKEDGRGLSIWDTYTHQHPERIVDGKTGDVANDQYHRYKEDVTIMKNMGMDAYRFSISWSRVLPSGKLSGGVNRKGIQFYNNLIDELLSKGLQPYVTLYHWDTPQQLEDEYGGFLSSQIVLDFQDYAELCYKEFGDRVKYWITINEPLSLSRDAYDEGKNAPGRCSQPDGNCTEGNSATEPYITGHNQLLAHAAAVKIYKKKYQGEQNGKVGITLNAVWMVPFSEAKIDNEAAQRAIEFSYGWFMDPLTCGQYPKIMQSLVGDRLPRFTKSQSDMLKGSYDFLGLNYYTANYAANRNNSNDVPESYRMDCRCQLTTEKDGVSIGPKTALSWLQVYPMGILNLLKYTKEKYDNPIIYITENGIAEANNSTLSLEEALKDSMRIDYHRRHLSLVLRAIKEGVNIKGYFAWSLLDNFEWKDGYTVRFGLNYVDFKTMKRYPKHSSIWFRKLFLR